MMRQVFFLFSAAIFVAAHHEPGHMVPQKAIVKLSSPSGQDVSGNVTFTQLADGKVQVLGTIFGLSQGEYGFHIHEKGDITGGCLSTGPHFNPEHKEHGHPGDANRHVGDLGNVAFDENRVANIEFTDELISLIGPYSILGRGLVLHEKADDFGRSNHPDSKKTGNAGGRVACGVVGILPNERLKGCSLLERGENVLALTKTEHVIVLDMSSLDSEKSFDSLNLIPLDPVYDWSNRAATSSLASAILLPVTTVLFLNY